MFVEDGAHNSAAVGEYIDGIVANGKTDTYREREQSDAAVKPNIGDDFEGIIADARLVPVHHYFGHRR
jgi:hypothetical protein